MKRAAAFVVLGLTLPIAGTTVSAQEKLDRTNLPIAEPKPPTYTELDARNVKAPPRFEVKAPKGAPNVVIVLIDDIGFGGPSTFGGPIRTPTMDQLAASGEVASARVERTQPNVFSADETADVGIDNQTPVAEGIGIGADTRFTGKIDEITLEVR